MPSVRRKFDAPDLKVLPRFMRTEDRRLTPFFVGLEADIERIMEAVADVTVRSSEKAVNPSKGELVLINGALGARKTALMDRLREIWNN